MFDRWMFQEDGKRREVQVTGTLSTTSGEVLHGWALASKGIALEAAWDIAADLRQRRLRQCLEAFSCDEVKLYAVHRSRLHTPPRIRTFVEFIAAAVRHVDVEE
jgi:DNA-binding transcriptional LysR family regulator